MCHDRGYLVTQDELDQTLEQFIEQFGDRPRLKNNFVVLLSTLVFLFPCCFSVSTHNYNVYNVILYLRIIHLSTCYVYFLRIGKKIILVILMRNDCFGYTLYKLIYVKECLPFCVCIKKYNLIFQVDGVYILKLLCIFFRFL